MQDMRKNIFRKAEAITSSDGLSGRGVILPKTAQDNYWGVRDELKEGELYNYMGDTDFKVGSVVSSCGESYIVLSSGHLAAFGKYFCSRAVLEKVGEAHD